jgi:hypothetical protein
MSPYVGAEYPVASVLMRVPLEPGSDKYILAEADPVDLDGLELVADDGTQGRVVQSAISLATAVDDLEPALQTIISRLRKAARGPDAITVEFGLKVGGEAGLIFAKGTAEATLNISVTWNGRSGSTENPEES